MKQAETKKVKKVETAVVSHAKEDPSEPTYFEINSDKLINGELVTEKIIHDLL